MADEPVEQHDVGADDDEVEARETDSVGSMAPWTPTPTAPARAFLQAHPDAAIDIQFPVVYEEDRTRMIADLSAARSEGVVAHRRLAERVAKELGIENYSYDDEQRAIAREQPALPRTPSSEPGDVGVGDKLAPRALDDDEEPVRRADLSGDKTAEFRKQQKSMSSTEVAASALLFRQIERDEHGTPVRVIEAYSGDSGVRVSRVVRDPTSGRITGVEPEPVEREDEHEEDDA